MDESNNNLSVVFDPLGTVLLRLATGSTFNDPNTRSAAIKPQRENERARPASMKMEPAAFEINEPPVIHIDRNVAFYHSLTYEVGEDIRHL